MNLRKFEQRSKKLKQTESCHSCFVEIKSGPKRVENSAIEAEGLNIGEAAKVGIYLEKFFLKKTLDIIKTL